ncbi:metalloregulator ArsR/SmtB family transcription factor [Staphylococcus arlettae]
MSSNKICDVICVHEAKVDSAVSFLKEENSQHLIDTLLKISDENKLKIILALIKEQKLCVCDLSIALGLSMATTSHHLRILYKRDVLNFYKDGKMAYYYIKDREMKSLLMKCLD